MKKSILILALAMFASCHKKQAEPTPATNNAVTTPTPCTAPGILKDVQWKPVLTGYIPIMFGSNGTYYESNYNAQGTWAFKCSDSITVTKATYYVKYKITSLTADTLKLKDAFNSINVYYK
jgi:hypothetical protein